MEAIMRGFSTFSLMPTTNFTTAEKEYAENGVLLDAKEHGVLVWLGLQPVTTLASVEAGWQSSFDLDSHNKAIEELRQWLANEAKIRQLPTFDFQQVLEQASGGNVDALLEDGLHPNKAGYRILGETAEDIVNQMIEGE